MKSGTLPQGKCIGEYLQVQRNQHNIGGLAAMPLFVKAVSSQSVSLLLTNHQQPLL